MVLAADARLGMAMRFRVVVDDIDLGGWNTCTGLQVTFKNKLVGEGGNYESRAILPERVEYNPVTLTRAMVHNDSTAVQRWLSTVVSKWYDASSPGDYAARTARITLLDAEGHEVVSWSLRGVYPAAWKGPDLRATSGEVAIETLQLIHEGFL